MSCGEKCSKFFLFVVNAIVWLVGAAFLAIGIWVAVSPATFIQQALNVVNIATQGNQSQQSQALALANLILSNSSMMMIGAYIMIAVGGFLFLVGFCGCCGACKNSKCLLIIYIVFCVLAFMVTLAGGIVEAVYLNQIGTYMTQGFTMLQNQYFDGMYNSTNPLSQLWFSVMDTQSCCGVYGPSDFSTNVSSMASYWNNNGRSTCAGGGQCFNNANVPASCCAMAAPTYNVNNTACPISGTGAYSVGCQSVFIAPFASQLKTYATIVMGVTFGLSAFCLLAVAAAATMVHHHRKNGGGGDRYA